MRHTEDGWKHLEVLPQHFREQAETLREFGADQQAQALEWAASEVETALQGVERQQLVLSGVSSKDE